MENTDTKAIGQKHIHSDVCISIALIAIGMFFLIEALHFPNDVGYFPIIFSVLMIVTSAFVLMNAVKQTMANRRAIAAGEEIKQAIKKSDFLNMLMSFGIVIAYVALISLLGFFSATVVFMMGYMYFLKMRNWVVMAGVTLVVNLLIYIVFVTQLRVLLPQGLLI